MSIGRRLWLGFGALVVMFNVRGLQTTVSDLTKHDDGGES